MNRHFTPRVFTYQPPGGATPPKPHFPEAFFTEHCMSKKVYEGIEAFVKGLEKDGTLERWEKQRKRQTAKSAQGRIIKAVNETLAEMEATR